MDGNATQIYALDREFPKSNAVYRIHLISTIVNIVIHLSYFFTLQFTPAISQRSASFFQLLTVYCAVIVFRAIFWIFTFLLVLFTFSSPLSTYCLQVSLYLDTWADLFGRCMLFLLAYTCFMSQKRPSFNLNTFGKHSSTIIVSFLVLSTAIASLVSFYFSNTKRLFESRIGPFDTVTSSAVRSLINRIFYVFPVAASSLCLFFFCVVRRQLKNRTLPRGTVPPQGGGALLHVFVTILLYLVSSALKEFVQMGGYSEDLTKRILAMTALNVFDNVVQLWLPLMIVLLKVLFREEQQADNVSRYSMELDFAPNQDHLPK